MKRRRSRGENEAIFTTLRRSTDLVFIPSVPTSLLCCLTLPKFRNMKEMEWGKEDYKANMQPSVRTAAYLVRHKSYMKGIAKIKLN